MLGATTSSSVNTPRTNIGSFSAANDILLLSLYRMQPLLGAFLCIWGPDGPTFSPIFGADVGHAPHSLGSDFYSHWFVLNYVCCL